MTEPTFNRILEAAAVLCNCSPVDILADRRAANIVRAREIVTLVMHDRGLSYPEIAAFFGRKSHSPFLYMHRRITRDLAEARTP